MGDLVCLKHLWLSSSKFLETQKNKRSEAIQVWWPSFSSAKSYKENWTSFLPIGPCIIPCLFIYMVSDIRTCHCLNSCNGPKSQTHQSHFVLSWSLVQSGHGLWYISVYPANRLPKMQLAFPASLVIPIIARDYTWWGEQDTPAEIWHIYI